MGWPFDGEWEGLNQWGICQVAAAVCRAINEREELGALFAFFDAEEAADQMTEWPVVGSMPVASSFLGFTAENWGALIQALLDRLAEIDDGPISGVTWMTDEWEVLGGTTIFSEATAAVTGGTLNPPPERFRWQNASLWLTMKEVLDRMVRVQVIDLMPFTGPLAVMGQVYSADGYLLEDTETDTGGSISEPNWGTALSTVLSNQEWKSGSGTFAVVGWSSGQNWGGVTYRLDEEDTDEEAYWREDSLSSAGFVKKRQIVDARVPPGAQEPSVARFTAYGYGQGGINVTYNGETISLTANTGDPDASPPAGGSVTQTPQHMEFPAPLVEDTYEIVMADPASVAPTIYSSGTRPTEDIPAWPLFIDYNRRQSVAYARVASGLFKWRRDLSADLEDQAA